MPLAIAVTPAQHRFQQQAAGLHHAQGAQPVEHGKGLLACDALQVFAAEFGPFGKLRAGEVLPIFL